MLPTEKKKITAVCVDCHEKIAAKCSGAPPSRAGRQHGGSVWPVLRYPNLNLVIYDRIFSCALGTARCEPWLDNAPKKEESKGKGADPGSFLEHLYGSSGVGPDADLIQMIERDCVDRCPSVKWESIAGLEQAKALLEEAVILPQVMPDYFQAGGTGWRVLMFGPPGTGKTMLAKAVATQCSTSFFNVSASTMASKYRGDSEKLVRLLFEMARFYSPTTIFFDEIDARVGLTNSSACETGFCVGSEESNETRQVSVLAATNRPWDLDEALRRRIYIPLPQDEGRKQLFEINLREAKRVDETGGDGTVNGGNRTTAFRRNVRLAIRCELVVKVKLGTDVAVAGLVEKTKGYSGVELDSCRLRSIGADVTNVCREAAMMGLRRRMAKARQEGVVQRAARLWSSKSLVEMHNLKQEVDVPVTQADFFEAIHNVNRSVGTSDASRIHRVLIVARRMRRGKACFKGREVLGEGEDVLLDLCKKVTERNVATVLLPEVLRSKQKLPQVLKLFHKLNKGNLAFVTLEALREDGNMKLKIDLHDFPERSAHVALCHWLSTAVAQKLQQSPNSFTCLVVTGHGPSGTELRDAALELFRTLRLDASPVPETPGWIRLVLTKGDLPTLRVLALHWGNEDLQRFADWMKEFGSGRDGSFALVDGLLLLEPARSQHVTTLIVHQSQKEIWTPSNRDIDSHETYQMTDSALHWKLGSVILWSLVWPTLHAASLPLAGLCGFQVNGRQRQRFLRRVLRSQVYYTMAAPFGLVMTPLRFPWRRFWLLDRDPPDVISEMFEMLGGDASVICFSAAAMTHWLMAISEDWRAWRFLAVHCQELETVQEHQVLQAASKLCWLYTVHHLVAAMVFAYYLVFDELAVLCCFGALFELPVCFTNLRDFVVTFHKELEEYFSRFPLVTPSFCRRWWRLTAVGVLLGRGTALGSFAYATALWGQELQAMPGAVRNGFQLFGSTFSLLSVLWSLQLLADRTADIYTLQRQSESLRSL
ncbi:unnamed protein product [Durusdinium trenchii]|uniref:AAA+ ATPase domain-containing protein n=1 Tax=Durusdinium trenchii TaxID=1381693 RepID=A0ABP0JQW7_9DINO